ncbi:hypothetical protein E0L36_25850 [Streptomyces sp. AJS327]|uniref:hypothetical protein n=1 Tax=Streptomyces sp. AJS327 TaxID=2545265 RepID=UPI0015DD6FC8|nr:hypothetical protein [Streptomyces sp. AJS327]MBA0054151.1 hypothetical protein [Streptomyces sp. AJS327]
MDESADFTGRLLADRYRLSQAPSEEDEFAAPFAGTVAYDTASGQEVLVHQLPLPEVVDAEVMDGTPGGRAYGSPGAAGPRGAYGRATRRPADPAARRAVEAALAASRIPDHPRRDQVFDVFVEDDGLWIVSELVPGLPLDAVLADRPLGPHRAAEIAADLLAALGAVHAHGWTHRNITAHTVLICEDGRALLTGLAVGAAEEALSGYDPLPPPGGPPAVPTGGIADEEPEDGFPEDGFDGGPEPGPEPGPRPEPALPPGRSARSPYADHVALDRPGADRGAPPPLAPGPVAPPWPGGTLPEGFTPSASAARPGTPGGPNGPYARPPYGSDPYAAERDDPYGEQGDPYSARGHDPYDEPPPGADGPFGASTGQAPGDRREFGRPAGSGGPGAHPGSDARPGPGTTGSGVEGTRGVPGGDSAEATERAARRGAIAAYRAGTQRAAAVRAEAEARQRRGDSDPFGPGQGSGHPGGPGAGRPAEASPAGGRGELTPANDGLNRSGADDEVRWLPADRNAEPPDAVDAAMLRAAERHPERPGPTALPGARQGNSRRVHSWWESATEPLPESADSRADGHPANPAGLPDGPHGPDAHGPEDVYGPDGAEDPLPEGWEEDAEEARPWGGEPADDGRYRGPTSALASERARHTRMMVVGPVTERWAPEQAGPVYDNWRLAPPVGPAADLWALGALLFRAVQGHAPYPEDSVADLVQMVCGEPPAFAEDCGPLRPVVESLMRQDPTERPDFEELRGWLRSLIRSAPEPEAGRRVVTAPRSLESGAADPRRLPIKRRRGELVRRRRAQNRPAARAEQRTERAERSERRAERKRGRGGRERGPARLGRLLLGAVLLGLTAAVLYALWFMPEGGAGGQQKGSVTSPSDGDQADGGDEKDNGASSGGSSDKNEDGEGGDSERDKGDREGGGKKDEDGNDKGEGGGSSTPPAKAPSGYVMRNDAAGFQVAVPKGWTRQALGGGRVRYTGDGVEMILVSGRDSAARYGSDPLRYQTDNERELGDFRSADWAEASEERRIEVGDQSMAEGEFSWQVDDAPGMFARNRAVLIEGNYHVLLVKGPESRRAAIDRHFENTVDTYRPRSAR